MRNLLVSLAVCVFVALLGAATTSAAVLYSPVYNDDQVVGFSTGSGGALTALAGSPFSSASGGTTSFTPSPDGTSGYTTYLFNGGLRSFTIDGSGAVAAAQPKIVSAEAMSGAIATNGKTFYVAARDPQAGGPSGETSGGIYAWSVGAAGALSPAAGSPYVDDSDFTDFVITPDGRFGYGATGNTIVRFAVNPDGSLSLVSTTSLGGVAFLMVSPDSRHLFAAGDGSGGDTITALAIGADSSLTPVGTPWTSEDVSTYQPGVSSDGRFVYQCDGNADKIYTIAVAADGSLSQVGAGIDFEDCLSPTVSQDGKFLYVQHRSSAPEGFFVAERGADGRPGPFTFVGAFDSAEPVLSTFLPGQGTNAALKITAGSKLLNFSFDASASTAVRGTVARFEWNFGDGTVVSSGPAAPTHKFAKAGVYDVSVTAYDELGCSSLVHDGHYARCNGSTGTARFKLDTPAWITSLSLKPKRVGKKTKIRYKLSEKARVEFVVEKPSAGRLVGKSCRKPSKSNRKGKRCTRWLRASKTFRQNGKAGKTNSLKFTGKVGRKQLAKGKYRLKAIATDSGKTKGPAKTLNFRIR